MKRLIHMQPIHEMTDADLAPSTTEIIQDVVQTGRLMFAAGQRMMRDLDRLRGSARGTEWEIRLTGHPYLWVAASVSACLLLAAMFREEDAARN